MWAANCDGDIHANGGQGNGTRHLCAAFAISVLQPSPGSAFCSVPCSHFYLLCSRCPGWGRTPGLCVVNLFTRSPGRSSEGTPGLIVAPSFLSIYQNRTHSSRSTYMLSPASLLHPPPPTLYSGQTSLPVLPKHTLQLPTSVPLSHPFFQPISFEKLLGARHSSGH